MIGDRPGFDMFFSDEALQFHAVATICKYSDPRLENHMTYDDLPISKKTASGVVGVAAILFYLWLLTWAGPVKAAPGPVMGLTSSDSQAVPARIYKRGRTPIYPYWSSGPGPRGWSSYFGFVPYTKGNIENEAVQRQFYPQDQWPHDPSAPPPQPWGLGY